MLNLPNIIIPLSILDTCHGEDFVDRLNFGVTVYLLLFFVLITGSKQHFGNPIQCMVPPESPESWVLYYHDYCYIQDKLRIFDMNIQKSVEYETKQRAGADITPIGRFLKEDSTKYWSPRVMYYQWVPYVLFLQAIFFLIPKLFWKAVGSHWLHGIDFKTVIDEASKLRTLFGEDRASVLSNLVNFIRYILNSKYKRLSIGSSTVSICYVVTKWLEVLNGFGQLYMLSCFIGQGDYFWGFSLLVSVLNGSDDPNVGVFPRIVLCDVTRFALANLHQDHMQCVLMLNFINEKIYTFLWFWIVFVSILSAFSAVRQTMLLLLPMYRALIAENLLPTQDVLFSSAAAEYGIRPNPVSSQALFEFFVHEVLRWANYTRYCSSALEDYRATYSENYSSIYSFFIIGGECVNTSNDRPARKKDSNLSFWRKLSKLPTTVQKMGFSEHLGASKDPQGASFNNNERYSTAEPLTRLRSLSVEVDFTCFLILLRKRSNLEKSCFAKNLEIEPPTAPLDSLLLISNGSTQAFDNSTCPDHNVCASSNKDYCDRTLGGSGVAVVDSRCHKT
ncbi:innexin-3 domain protein [Dictyocaulus viviparus]|uniref:Innexin n=1 Tax=Dictyocaulus viviparus TaxID=29172 RepID=A0A0D8YBA5_DICVI|nr:innexin-3 domain protein [Dictyocaulus viviparus]